MWSRLAPWLRGADVGWAYAAVVLVVAVVVRVLPGTTTDELVLDSSTNLDNLRRTPHRCSCSAPAHSWSRR